MNSEATSARPVLPLSFRLYVVLLLAAVLVVVPSAVTHVVDLPRETTLWVAFITASSLLTVPMVAGLQLEVSLGAPILVAASVLFAPSHAVLLAFLGAANRREFMRGTSPWLIIFNRAQLALSAGAAAWVAHQVALWPSAELFTDTAFAGLVYNVVNSAALTAMLVLRGQEGVSTAARDATAPFKQFAVDFALVTALSLLVVIAYEPLGAWAPLLIALPVWLGYNALKSGREAQDRAEQLAAQVEDLERLTARLREAQAARESLSTQVLQEGATERSRIALDLHDVVLPFLAAAEIQADNISSALEAGEEEIAARLAAATRDAVHSSIASIRQTLEDLRNQTTAPGELRQRITKLLNEMNVTHGLATHLDAPEDLSALPAAVEIVLADTLRGLLSNVARHAEAQKVSVHLSVEEHRVLLEVEDDGKGFEVGDRMQQGGHGLALLQQRVALARGQVRVRSQPGEGTTVSVEVPL